METISPFLIPTLQLAVNMRVMELRKIGHIPDHIIKHIQNSVVNNIIEHGDDLQFGGKYCKETFNDLVLAISVLSFQSTGIKIFGLHFKAEFGSMYLKLTTEEANHLDGALCHWMQFSQTQLVSANSDIIAKIHKELCDKISIRENPQLPTVTRYPKQGESYLHYKGQKYDIVGTAVLEGDLTTLVIYTDGAKVWARPLESFNEILGNGTTQYYRFTKVNKD